MNKLIKILLIFTILIIAASVLWINHQNQMYEDTFQSEYQYDISIKTLQPLHNVTLYLPLPSDGNESFFSEGLKSENNLNKPTGWNCTITETKHGKMLQITAQKIDPEFHSTPVPIEEGQDKGLNRTIKESTEYSEDTPIPYPEGFSIYQNSDHELDTKNPLENEVTFIPKYSIKEVPNQFPNDENENAKTYQYESRIYAQYNTTAENTVDISMSFIGMNNWWVYGWNGNQYHEHLHITLKGDQDGWTPIEGEIVTGEGNYR
ncbi:hypothetical protein [Methanohalophilus mahii]|uniref:Uncharacterized protein n=1 Tax=Methanohalophilus mahii (strain ATCC 35705 / DSM 5219 / SLP) TaxID=547558 RepID=D5EB75_METMS|nr:hypothetical protein [Methanohalophilus mahii]ADE36426.1 hypothetical protein Mmah_0905 [Methanohalophilus mahii DSM 5219]